MSTSDRELLELAARAAGKNLSGYEWYETPSNPDERGFIVYAGDATHTWNTLRNDGDALRLAVNVGVFDGPASFAKFYSWLADAMIVEDGEAKAFRRAITCYAAEIGRAMP